jgi:hypothetical protein
MSVNVTAEMAWPIIKDHMNLPDYVYKMLKVGGFQKWTLKSIIYTAKYGNDDAFKLMVNSDVFLFRNSIVFEEYLDEAIKFANKGDVRAFKIMISNIPADAHITRDDEVKLMIFCNAMSDEPNLLDILKIVAASPGLKRSIPSIFVFLMYKCYVRHNLDAIEFLLSCGIPLDEKCVWEASHKGDTDFLVWINKHGFEIDVNAILNAGLVV